MTDKTYLFKVKYQSFAKKNSIPAVFAGVVLKSTDKAYQINGKGVMLKKKLGICGICGRELSNPNSIKLGIGPVCAARMGIDILTGYTDKNIEKELHKIEFTKWLPKSVLEDIGIENADNIPVFEKDKGKHKDQKKTPEIKKEATKKGDKLYITFPFDAITLSNVKSLSGRRFHKEPTPHWTCPDTEEARLELKSWGFTLLNLTFSDGKKKMKRRFKIPDFPVYLDKTLFPYQKEGVKFIFKKKGRALIGDEMGLGKSLQAITYALMEKKIKKILVLCPASLKLNWAKEFSTWATDYNLFILSGRNKPCNKKRFEDYQVVSNKNAKRDIFICNYDIIGNKLTIPKGKKKPVEHLYTGWVDCLIEKGIDLVIGDEIHFIKNQKTQRSHGVLKIVKKVKRFLPMSGTPIINRPVEFWPCLNALNSGMFNSYWNYAKKYCGAEHNGYGWDFTGASNTEQLNTILKSVMIRRLKDDVLKELPSKIRSVIPLELTNKREYKHAEDNLYSYLMQTKGRKKAQASKKAETLVQIEILKQLAFEGKKKACLEWIKDHLESNGKLIVFGYHKKTLDYIEKEFKKISVRVDGSTKNADRQKAVDRFQTDNNIRLFIGNIKAAGVGLTLTAASSTCFLEFGWTPGEHDQAEDRCHRIGQKADSVNAYYLVGNNTIDVDIMNLLDKKRRVLDAVLDGEKVEEVSFIDMLKQKKGIKNEST